jgi:hypothetical protein
MDMLKRYTLAELRQLSIYLEEYQNCEYVEPSENRKKAWLNSTTRMILSKNPENVSEYVNEIRTIIRWFLDNKFKFVRGRNFFYKMVNHFHYRITDTDVYLKPKSAFVNRTTTNRDFTIRRCYMDLSTHADFIARHPIRDEEIIPPVPSPQQYEVIVIDDYDNELFRLLDSPSHSKQREITDQEATDETRSLECRICATNKICIVLSKCGHTFCNSCTNRFENKCAVCRTQFTNSTKIHMFI